MDLFTKYLYLLGSLIALLLFIIIFYFRNDLRHRMLLMGIGMGLASIFLEGVFFKDYWHPPLIFRFGKFGGIEDYIVRIDLLRDSLEQKKTGIRGRSKP